MERKKTVVVDIPVELLNSDRATVVETIRGALRDGLDRHFDPSGKFNGIFINFEKQVFPADGKKRLNDCERLTFIVDHATYALLAKAKCHTTMSLKNFAEVIILKELLSMEGGNAGDAEDGYLHNEQSDETNG